MQNPGHSSLTLARQDLEDVWRLRFEMARERYEKASIRYRKLLGITAPGLIPRPDDPLILARHAESEELEEYTRILRIFTELTVHGRIPEEQSAERADGGQN